MNAELSPFGATVPIDGAVRVFIAAALLLVAIAVAAIVRSLRAYRLPF